ncbi:phosphate acyltransferase PlsX [Thermithiobacillus plumbiphilus]|uniref:Phosphate acyltransferase n=1 Tax=Thermithiobacillus plumbiphilus TaxID=1729899 RepID=A0ABU9D6V6_9PROT
MKIAVDAMGGDFGPEVIIPASLAFLEETPEANIILLGQEDLLRQELLRHGASNHGRLQVQHAPQVVGMDEAPSQALRGKRNSSMRLGIDLIKTGAADALVSAGNTGALMAMGKVILRTIPGIDRPAIATTMPTRQGKTLMLDLGANVDCDAHHLYQFAIMGDVFARLVMNLPRPSIGLLNIGEEEIKGNETVKEAAVLLRGSSLNFHGNVEGSDIYRGTTDVVVCDGFVGNVALKVSEGLAQMIRTELKEAYQASWYGRLTAVLSLPVLRRFRDRLDHRRYNGATLLGLNGIIIKSHGNADAFAFAQAIRVAAAEVRHHLIANIAQEVQVLLAEHQETTA